MEDLINKLKDLNRIDPLFNYDIQILSSGGFILHGAHNKCDIEKHIDCDNSQTLREKMYRIILKTRQDV